MRPCITQGGSTGRFTITLTTHTHTHSALDEGIGTAVKNSSEIIIKQVRLEDGFKREGRIRVAECLR